VNFFRYSQIQVTVCATGKEKSKLPVEAQLFCRRFDCPAFLLTAEETGQTNRLSIEPIRQRTQRAFLKSRDSTKMFRRSDFRNAGSVRKIFKRKPAKAMKKIIVANSHRSHESNADGMHPSKRPR
jgi:hypothetical protein